MSLGPYLFELTKESFNCHSPILHLTHKSIVGRGASYGMVLRRTSNNLEKPNSHHQVNDSNMVCDIALRRMTCCFCNAIKVIDACIETTVHSKQTRICLSSSSQEPILEFAWNHNIPLSLTRPYSASPIVVYLAPQLFCTTKGIRCRINYI